MDRTEYPLFPLDFALRDVRNRTKQATSLVEKKAVLSRIIPALTNSESVKKGEAAKCRDFTRCSVIKAYTSDASYQYVDEDKGEAVQFSEYERRYHLFLEDGKDKKQREAEKERQVVEQDQAAEEQEQREQEQEQKHKEHKATATGEGGAQQKNAAAAVEKENMGVNVVGMDKAGGSKGEERGVAEDKASFAKSNLHDAMWANIAALSRNLRSNAPPSSATNQKPRAPLTPLEPSSPKKERSNRGTRQTEAAPEMKRGGADDDEDGEEDTVDFKSLRVSVLDVEEGCVPAIKTQGTGLSSPAEMPSPVSPSNGPTDTALGMWTFSKRDADKEEEPVFTPADAAEARQRAKVRMENRVEAAQAQYQWDLVGIELMSSRSLKSRIT